MNSLSRDADCRIDEVMGEGPKEIIKKPQETEVVEKPLHQVRNMLMWVNLLPKVKCLPTIPRA